MQPTGVSKSLTRSELGPDVFEDLCRELVQEEDDVTSAER